MNQLINEELMKINKQHKKNIIVNIDLNKKYEDEFYDEFLELYVVPSKKKLFYHFIKRLFDIILSLIMIIILSPIFIIFAILIKIDSKGPVIFKNRRVGKKGKIFKCYKFRSMRVDAPKEMATSQMQNPDMYITKIGKFIRKTSIDELPQLFNVLFGSMSFIGPRPVVPTEKKLVEMREKLGVYQVKPGVSGYSQVYGRDNVYYKNKAIMDSIYVKKRSLWFDFKLCFKTVICVLKREGNNDDEK